MQKGTVYYFTQAGIDRSRRFATLQQAVDNVLFEMQRHNAVVHVKQAVVGQPGSTLVKTYTAGA